MNVKKGILFAILAALLYALSSPLSKLMLDYISPTLMAGFLYLGAGLGMCIISIFRRLAKRNVEKKLSKAELPYVIAMILLDIAAPICLLFGLKDTSAANASLLNNFEIVATAIVAFFIFKEKISSRLWVGIVFVTLACFVLSFEVNGSFQFSSKSLLIILASVFWGIENNCTRKISSKDPLQIVFLKGIFSGIGAIIIGLCIGEKITIWWSVLIILLVGFIAYGLSIFFYVYAQRILGAARTSAYYAFAPFIGTAISIAIFREIPYYNYYIGLALLIVGAWLSSKDKPLWRKNQIKRNL